MSNDSHLFENYVRRGDLESFSALVSRHGVWMLVLLRGILNSVSDADDAFQDTWIRVIKSADRYKGGNIRAYLATVARSVAIREIAETMDIPIGTALTWMQSAKVKLKKILGRLK